MSFQFASLGSGSKGNATLVRVADSLLLIDCGFSVKQTVLRLQQLGVSAEQLDAILVTHEHTDHVKGVAALARKYAIKVYASRGTIIAANLSGLSRLEAIQPDTAFKLADAVVMPVTVPHDAREPCQFIIKQQQKTFGLLTDLGCITRHIVECYHNCDAIMLECNHDLKMLASGSYPSSLKRRVGGNWGHLNNHQAADFLNHVNSQSVQHLVLSHISEQNNTAELALSTVIENFSEQHKILVAEQNSGFNWKAII